MKYYKVSFHITDNNEKEITDPVIFETAKDVLYAVTAEAGFESFEDCDGGTLGFIQKTEFNEDELKTVLESFPVEGIAISYEIADAEDKNWNHTWEEKGFEPIIIEGKCIIHDTIHPVESQNKNMLDITIDMRQAFGTGTHDTTRMIVTQLLNLNLKGLNVLDCGCGTGILSIVASKVGASSVCAYDIDEWSVENTRHNCELNNIKNVTVAEGNAGVIKTFNKHFDLVLANINRNILLADMPAFRAAMNNGAMLILSGFYKEDVPILQEKAESLGLKLVKSSDSNDWCMLVFNA